MTYSPSSEDSAAMLSCRREYEKLFAVIVSSKCLFILNLLITRPTRTPILSSLRVRPESQPSLLSEFLDTWQHRLAHASDYNWWPISPLLPIQ
jgi:hypothetical protein